MQANHQLETNSLDGIAGQIDQTDGRSIICTVR